MPEAAGEPKKVPKRSDVKPQGLIRNDGQVQVFGQDPDYVYQSFSQKEDHPGWIGNFTRPHFYGQGQPWGQWVGPWEPVNAVTGREHVPATSTAQGAPVDTRQYGPGNQLVCRMHRDEYAKYQETDRKNSEERSNELRRPDVRRGSLQSLTTVLSGGTVSPAEALAQAGHPMPAGMTIRQ
jgi:hypothetical protein